MGLMLSLALSSHQIFPYLSSFRTSHLDLPGVHTWTETMTCDGILLLEFLSNLCLLILHSLFKALSLTAHSPFQLLLTDLSY